MYRHVQSPLAMEWGSFLVDCRSGTQATHCRTGSGSDRILGSTFESRFRQKGYPPAQTLGAGIRSLALPVLQTAYAHSHSASTAVLALSVAI